MFAARLILPQQCYVSLACLSDSFRCPLNHRRRSPTIPAARTLSRIVGCSGLDFARLEDGRAARADCSFVTKNRRTRIPASYEEEKAGVLDARRAPLSQVCPPRVFRLRVRDRRKLRGKRVRQRRVGLARQKSGRTFHCDVLARWVSDGEGQIVSRHQRGRLQRSA